MKKELDEYLCTNFPLLYRERHQDMRTTCMCWGFDFQDGWYPLILQLSQQLEPLIQKQEARCQCSHGEHQGKCTEQLVWHDESEPCECEEFKPATARCVQAKEKFGSLRFYMDYATDEMYQLVQAAEHDSAETCEVCGAAGTLRQDGWWKTRCDQCESAYHIRMAEENRLMGLEAAFRQEWMDRYDSEQLDFQDSFYSDHEDWNPKDPAMRDYKERRHKAYAPVAAEWKAKHYK